MGYDCNPAVQTRAAAVTDLRRRLEGSWPDSKGNQISRRLVKDSFRPCKEDEIVGRLWIVGEDTITRPDGSTHQSRFIGVYLICDYGPKQFATKGLSEAERPYFYDCPVSFLKLVPEGTKNQFGSDETQPEWRRAVRAAHDARKLAVVS